jgi:tRNA threonylcarbamoyl adenosine modification protein YjeE
VEAAYAIVSPTFTLLNVYPGRTRFFHADLYRLSQGEAQELELLEEAAGGALAVEWAERAGEIWPARALKVELAPEGEDARRARIGGPEAILARLRQELDREAERN